MEPPPPPSSPPATSASPPTKLRLMCSYGGQILPRPHDKTLSYVGGDTRLILSDRHVSLSDLTARLSKTLLNNNNNNNNKQTPQPFSLKYQLPSEDLDSLISVTTDEDLENMVEEYDRILATSSSSSSGRKAPTRIRLFLFTDQAKGNPFRADNKSEEWFLNALNGSTRVGSDLDLDLSLPESASVNCLLGLDDVAKEEVAAVTRKQQDVHSVPDSPILDTSSSFGSTSSSAAIGNLAPIRVKVEAAATGETEGKREEEGFFVVPAAEMAVVRVPATVPEMASPNSVSSDNSLTNTLSRPRNMIYQDPGLQIQMQNQNQYQNTPSNRVPTPIDPKLSTDSNPNYLFPTQFEQQFQQINPQQPHYIQSGSQYIPQGAVPAPAYYIVYPPQQQYPSPYVSARPAQPYNIQSSYAPSVGSSQNPQQFMGYPPIHHQSQSIAPSSVANTGSYTYEYADTTNPRVVYTQQMAPQMAVPYQNTSPVLSEALTQVPNESFKQQNRAAQL